MLYSSAELNKLLRNLQDDLEMRRSDEAKNCKFNCATVEDVEDVRPDYDYVKERVKQMEIVDKILKIKHAINVFNSTTILSDNDLTIDQALVYMPVLNREIATLTNMLNTPEKKRVSSFSSQIIDYQYANFDHGQVRADYEAARNELNNIQRLLDEANAVKCIELDI